MINKLSLLDGLDHHPFKEPMEVLSLLDRLDHHPFKEPMEVLSLLDRLDHHPYNGLSRNCHFWTDSFDIRDPLKITFAKYAN